MAHCLIGFGANLLDRAAAIDQAIEALDAHPDVRVVARSTFLETMPIGGPAGQEAFLNAAATIETSLAPEALLAVARAIENDLGRERHQRWGARNIDLDLLIYDDLVLSTSDLELPHPRMSFRRFVIEPAAEIAPDLVHPTVGWSLARLRDHLRHHPPYVAIAGPIGVGKSRLAKRLCQELGGRLLPEKLSDERLTAFYAQAKPHSSPSRRQPTEAAGEPSAAGLSWSTEIEFLQDRTEQLDRSRWAVDESGQSSLAISDYWFDQSLAFAQVWLPGEQHAEYQARWEAARQTVIVPKLLIVLDAPVDRLRQAIAERGRPYEAHLTQETLTQLRDSLFTRIVEADHGPMLSLSIDRSRAEDEADVVFDEAVAAIAAMA